MPAEAAALQSAIRSFAIDERIQQGRGAVRATLFHLVQRQSVDAYRAAAETALSTLLSPWSGTVSGPWPPFAFAPELIT